MLVVIILSLLSSECVSPDLHPTTPATTGLKPRKLSFAIELLAKPCDPDPALDPPPLSPTVTVVMQSQKTCSPVVAAAVAVAAVTAALAVVSAAVTVVDQKTNIST